MDVPVDASAHCNTTMSICSFHESLVSCSTCRLTAPRSVSNHVTPTCTARTAQQGHWPRTATLRGFSVPAISCLDCCLYKNKQAREAAPGPHVSRLTCQNMHHHMIPQLLNMLVKCACHVMSCDAHMRLQLTHSAHNMFSKHADRHSSKRASA